MNEDEARRVIQEVLRALERGENGPALGAVEVEPMVSRLVYVAGNQGNIAFGTNIRQYIVNLVVQQARMIAVQHAVPSLTGIVGREIELGELARYLEMSDNADITRREAAICLFGVAGIGKSTLATMYYHRYAERYAQRYWRSLSTDSTISGLVAVFAEVLDKPFDQSAVPNEDNQAMLLVGWLRELPEPYLLVLDDCEYVLDDDGNARPGWGTLFGEADLGQAQLLLTSRRHVRAKRKRVSSYDIEGLDAADGITLLRQWGLGDADEAQLQDAVTKCGGHPLALIFLAQLVVEDDLPLGALLLDKHLWEREVAANLLDAVYQRLSKRQKQLICYFSIFDRPPYFRQAVSPVDVAGMLRLYHGMQEAERWQAASPSDEDSPIKERQAHRPRYLSGFGPKQVAGGALDLSRRALLNPAQGRYTMHAIVRDYAYPLLHESDRHAYHQAAASYFAAQYQLDPVTSPPHDPVEVAPLINAFDQFCEAGDYPRASAIIRDQPLEYMKGGSPLPLFALLGRWGELRRRLVMAERLAGAAPGLLSNADRAGALNNLGLALTGVGQYQQALERYHEALRVAEASGDQYAKGLILGSLGNVLYRLARYVEAAEYLHAALKIAEGRGDLLTRSSRLSSLGLIHTALGQYDEAIKYHIEAAATAQEAGDLSGESADLGNIGNICRNLGRYEEAVSYHQQALTVAQEVGDIRLQANHLGNLGNVYRNMGRYQEALNCHEEALATAEAMADLSVIGSHLGSLGLDYYYLKDYASAARYHLAALAVSDKTGDRRGKSKDLGNLGNVYAARGDFALAARYHREALEIEVAIGDLSGEGACWNNLAWVYENMSRYIEAITCYLKAVAIGERTHSPFVEARRRSIDGTRSRVAAEEWDNLYAQAARQAADPNFRPGVPEES